MSRGEVLLAGLALVILGWAGVCFLSWVTEVV